MFNYYFYSVIRHAVEYFFVHFVISANILYNLVARESTNEKNLYVNPNEAELFESIFFWEGGGSN